MSNDTDTPGQRILQGDSDDILDEFEDDYFHAIVTDPPYNLSDGDGFMGREWDAKGSPKAYQEWCEEWASEALRVLKPGGHLVAFSGNRTHHRLFSAVEDAGFEIRDTLTYHYGCLSEDTEIKTADGWKTHDEISEDDDVLAFDPDEETLQYEGVNETFEYDHSGEMIHYESAETDQLVTPNHRVLHRNDEEWETIYAAGSSNTMELPTIDASREIRLPRRKDVSGVSDRVGRDHVEGSRRKGGVFSRVLERTSGMGTARSVKTSRVKTSLGVRRDGEGDLCESELRRSALDTTQSGENQGTSLLRTELLQRISKPKRGVARTLNRNSPKRTRRVDRGVDGLVYRSHVGREQPVVEGRRHREKAKGQLQAGEDGPLSRRVLGNGAVKRLRPGSPPEGGYGTRTVVNQRGVRASCESRQPRQSVRELGTLPEQSDSQTGRRESRGVRIGTTLARTSRVDYDGVVWCVSVPSSYFVARRNGKAFITGNSGFPKGSDVGKHIDRFYDAEDERAVVGEKSYAGGHKQRSNAPRFNGRTHNSGEEYTEDTVRHETAPATSEAEQWDGWRTTLKPSTEFAVLARAPMSESAVYRNVLEHGTGALNINRTRIPSDGSHKRPYQPGNDERTAYDSPNGGFEPTNADGRYPANLLLDPEAAAMLDEQSGELHGAMNKQDSDIGDYDATSYKAGVGKRNPDYYGDEGGASRFFKTVEPTRFKYTSKACKSERTINGKIENNHSTVKPLDLMEWLVTLVTAPGQRVLDPFAGSGTTIMACKRLGREGIGIEKDAEHADLARKRVELAHELETDFTESGSFPETHREAPSFNEWLENRDEGGEDDGPATLESFSDADDD